MSIPPRVSVVLPAFRLGPVIAQNLKRTLEALEPVTSFELVVVDDGSPDATYQEAARLAEVDPRVSVVRHRENRGKGEALLSGWKASRGEVVVFLDADLDLPPEQIPDLLPALDEADVVVGSKRGSMSEGNYPTVRRALSRLYASITHRMLGLPVSESQTGLKLFRREVLDTVLPQVRVRGYAFDLELVVRAHRAGFRVAEAPVRLSPDAADSSLRPHMMWDLGRDTLKILWWTRRGGV
ncbi:MAG: dolichol-phosphate mannosyltransferase [Acidimicrobiia bacterium]|nr:MAG: dolichol-phosphate mannosyltransferase [Acidimicrobiia bacterium]